MSKNFQIADRVLWNPSNGVAELFIRTAEMFASIEDMPVGVGDDVADEREIDPDTFSAFVDTLARRYLASRHPILRSLLEGFTATALVLVQRAGRSLPSLGGPQAPGPNDVSVGPAGFAAGGSAERLLALAEEHARAMPR